MHGLVHFEISAKAPEQTKNFLEGMFGWNIQPAMEGYWMCSLGDNQPGFGLGGCEEAGGNESTCGYFEVANVGEAVIKAESLGAKTMMPETKLPNDHGVIALIAMPGSNQALGLWAKS